MSEAAPTSVALVDYRRAGEFDAAIRSRSAHIGIVGLGYAGLPLAVGFAEAGFPVTGIDKNIDRATSVNQRRSYLPDVHDDRLAGLPKLAASNEFGNVDDMAALTICVPTPLSKTRTPDLSAVISAAHDVAKHITPGALVVLQSTTVPETTAKLLLPIFEEATGGGVGEDFYLGYAPERVDPANKDGWTLRSTPKIVSGITPECARRTRLLYETVCDTVVDVSSTTTAELVKLYENTFRQVNIALANELALVCGRLGISAWEVIDAAATKPFGFLAHYPGPGLGGDCIPVVPHFISHHLKEYGFQTRMIEVAHEVNTTMPRHVVDRVAEALNDEGLAIRGARILLLGVAYKPNVSDLRESPALEIFGELQRRGATLAYCDPHVDSVIVEDGVYNAAAWEAETLADAGCVVMLTHHDEFLATPLWQTSDTLIVDTRNVVTGAAGTVVSI
jgi:UDP-N-acetyl-D-glucosamine dehydrogenase